MLLVASETGHVYTFATRKLKPMITSEAGKALIRTCLFSPEPPASNFEPRMSAAGYEETELSYSLNEDSSEKVREMEKTCMITVDPTWTTIFYSCSLWVMQLIWCWVPSNLKSFSFSLLSLSSLLLFRPSPFSGYDLIH